MKTSVLFLCLILCLCTTLPASNPKIPTDGEVLLLLKEVYHEDDTAEALLTQKLPVQGVCFREDSRQSLYLANEFFLRIQGHRVTNRLGKYLAAHPTIEILYLSDVGELNDSDLTALQAHEHLRYFKLGDDNAPEAICTTLINFLPTNTLLDLPRYPAPDRSLFNTELENWQWYLLRDPLREGYYWGKHSANRKKGWYLFTCPQESPRDEASQRVHEDVDKQIETLLAEARALIAEEDQACKLQQPQLVNTQEGHSELVARLEMLAKLQANGEAVLTDLEEEVDWDSSSSWDSTSSADGLN